jgi:hypothetical protein
MASLRKRGRNWYYAVVGPDSRRRELKGCSDKRATEQLAAAEAEAARVRAGLLDPRAARVAEAARRPIRAPGRPHRRDDQRGPQPAAHPADPDLCRARPNLRPGEPARRPDPDGAGQRPVPERPRAHPGPRGGPKPAACRPAAWPRASLPPRRSHGGPGARAAPTNTPSASSPPQRPSRTAAGSAGRSPRPSSAACSTRPGRPPPGGAWPARIGPGYTPSRP